MGVWLPGLHCGSLYCSDVGLGLFRNPAPKRSEQFWTSSRFFVVGVKTSRQLKCLAFGEDTFWWTFSSFWILSCCTLMKAIRSSSNGMLRFGNSKIDMDDCSTSLSCESERYKSCKHSFICHFLSHNTAPEHTKCLFYSDRTVAASSVEILPRLHQLHRSHPLRAFSSRVCWRWSICGAYWTENGTYSIVVDRWSIILNQSSLLKINTLVKAVYGNDWKKSLCAFSKKMFGLFHCSKSEKQQQAIVR